MFVLLFDLVVFVLMVTLEFGCFEFVLLFVIVCYVYVRLLV